MTKYHKTNIVKGWFRSEKDINDIYQSIGPYLL
jgi:hypothetical protein